AYKGVPGQFKNFNDADVFSILRKIIIGIGENYDEADFHFEEDVYSLWINSGRMNYLLKINRQTFLVDKKRIFQDGKIAAEIFYQGYKQLEEKLFPTHIKIFFPSPKVTIEFHFDSLILNEELSDSLFVLSLPSDIKWFPLSKFPKQPWVIE
ncbi:MAG: DUF4292 domain-containing protein, partial [Deltaproteobacteria bacterium]|nr:DUF4292 domain-containing protein [Deltaproteobacteria bacterium]